MPYRLKPHKPIQGQVRRIAVKQFDLAAAALGGRGGPASGAIHEARKHIKKVRALLRLVRPAIGDEITLTIEAEFRQEQETAESLKAHFPSKVQDKLTRRTRSRSVSGRCR